MSAPKSSGSEKFSRFGEKRKIVSQCILASLAFSVCVWWNMQGSDTAGYDEYVEGVEPDETSSLETPLKEVAIMLYS